MKKTIYTRFDKKIITSLPVDAFEGEIKVINTADDAAKAVDYLMTQPLLGIDTETRPSFTKGLSYKVALLQVSSEDVCYLFRLNKIGITPAIKYLLEETKVKKIGLSLHDDLPALSKRETFVPGGYIDLQDIMINIGIKDMSLQKLYANIFGKKINKGKQLSNWEACELTLPQQKYAATDAWACIKLYQEYLRLLSTRDYDLVVVPDPEPVVPEGDNEDNENNDK